MFVELYEYQDFYDVWRILFIKNTIEKHNDFLKNQTLMDIIKTLPAPPPPAPPVPPPLPLPSTELDLCNSSPPLSLAKIIRISKTHTITKLSLSCNDLYYIDAKYISQSPSIKTLIICENYLGSKGAKYLSKSQSITKLYISYNNIGNKGFNYLAKNKIIKTLDICCNKITKVPKDIALKTLDISYNNIGPKGIKYLSQNKTITSLDITEVGGNGANELVNNYCITRLDYWPKSWANIRADINRHNKYLKKSTLTTL